MDNREAFEEAAREIYEHVNFARGDDYIFDGEKRAYKLWQAATAHNTDAVIDECVNDVTQILQLISIYYAEKLPTYDARAGLSVICSNYPESLRNKLRSLKTNKEG